MVSWHDFTKKYVVVYGARTLSIPQNEEIIHAKMLMGCDVVLRFQRFESGS